MTGSERIAAERQRQIEKEGWTAEHDAQHREGELAFAACYYAMPCMLMRRCEGSPCPIIPEDFLTLGTDWDAVSAKRVGKSRLRQLEIAGALIAAEIDRLLALGEE